MSKAAETSTIAVMIAEKEEEEVVSVMPCCLSTPPRTESPAATRQIGHGMSCLDHGPLAHLREMIVHGFCGERPRQHQQNALVLSSTTTANEQYDEILAVVDEAHDEPVALKQSHFVDSTVYHHETSISSHLEQTRMIPEYPAAYTQNLNLASQQHDVKKIRSNTTETVNVSLLTDDGSVKSTDEDDKDALREVVLDRRWDELQQTLEYGIVALLFLGLTVYWIQHMDSQACALEISQQLRSSSPSGHQQASPLFQFFLRSK